MPIRTTAAIRPDAPAPTRAQAASFDPKAGPAALRACESSCSCTGYNLYAKTGHARKWRRRHDRHPHECATHPSDIEGWQGA
eukprot:11659677-Alexandrium_andersonii.AAC.1